MGICKFCKQSDLYTDDLGYCPICNVMKEDTNVAYDPNMDTYVYMKQGTTKAIVINGSCFSKRSQVVKLMYEAY